MLTNLLNIHQSPSKSLREYHAQFNEETIMVIHPNQEMFVEAFQNRLRATYLNESLSYRLVVSMAEVVTRLECYIKGEERNVEKN